MLLVSLVKQNKDRKVPKYFNGVEAFPLSHTVEVTLLRLRAELSLLQSEQDGECARNFYYFSCF